MILLIIFALISLLGITILIMKFRLTNYNQINSKFKEEIQELSREFNRKREEELFRFKESIQTEIDQLKAERNNAEIKYHNDVQEIMARRKNLNDSFNKEVENLDNIHKEFLASKEQEVEHQIEKIEENKRKREQELQNQLFIAQEDFRLQEEELQNQITQKKREIESLIASFKKDEAARQEKNFYRLTINETANEDICKLKKIAQQLNDPTILYKLIWKTYYEPEFNKMIGRVLGDKKDSKGIYKITNTINQMVYIGQTNASFNTRWRAHCRRATRAEQGSSNKLYTAMWEDGLENFTFQVVEFCEGKELLNDRERFWISFYNSIDYGYNTLSGNSNKI